MIDEGPQRTVRRYHPLEGTRQRRQPVLLVPPLAAPAICFDLRRGCSVAEHLLRAGHPTYLVDYGEIEYADRELGLEHWIEEVMPKAIRAASEDAGGRPVQLVGWCLGGIMSLLALAADPALPVSRVALVASPFDFSKVPLVAPLRPIAAITQGWGISQLYRLLGGAPAPLVKRGYQLAGFDKYLTEAVDRALQPARPRAARPDRGGRRVHGPHARLPRAHVRPAVPPLLPHQRPRRRPARARGPDARPRGREACRCWRSRAAATGSRRCRPATTSRRCSRTPRCELATAPGGHLGVLTGRAAAGTTWKLLDGFLDKPATRRAKRAKPRAGAA